MLIYLEVGTSPAVHSNSTTGINYVDPDDVRRTEGRKRDIRCLSLIGLWCNQRSRSKVPS
jgi:hypothetical protein